VDIFLPVIRPVLTVANFSAILAHLSVRFKEKITKNPNNTRLIPENDGTYGKLNLSIKKAGNQPMQVIVTVIGTDKVGIIAKVTTKLAALNVNILDVSQTIMQGAFTMMLLAKLPEDGDFGAIKADLQDLGADIGVEVKIARQEIFDAMHKL
jgi:ACT domain-containing protein